MKPLNKILILLVLLSATVSLSAQDIILKGKVVTFNEIPVANASIYSTKYNRSALSDDNGKFEITCSSNDKLIIKANGFVKHKLRVNKKIESKTLINLSLKNSKHAKETALNSKHIKDSEMFLKLYNENAKNTYYSRYATVFDILKDKTKSARRNRNVEYKGGELNFTGYNGIHSANDVVVEVNGKVVEDNAIDTISPNEVTHLNIVSGRKIPKYLAMRARVVVKITTTEANK